MAPEAAGSSPVIHPSSINPPEKSNIRRRETGIYRLCGTGTQLIGRTVLHIGQARVRVGVQRDLHLGVPEPLRHDVNRLARRRGPPVSLTGAKLRAV